ncbi:MAG: phospholipase D-like domain-containing anti-phage protein [Chloroflexota bacterium]
MAGAIQRYSSRRAGLRGFLPDLLKGASGYDRIAGYFNSSILEVAGEPLEATPAGTTARVICNSELDPLDVATAKAAQAAMFREWCAALPEDVPEGLRARLERLANFLQSGKLRVKVLPDRIFGLIHGKAGVITRVDGSAVSFMGSANESKRAWTMNYEIVWTDESQEGIDWVRDEFDALWSHPDAFDLADAVVKDIVRLSRRVVIPAVPDWRSRDGADAGAAVVELPVYRQENGLWAHQKSFVARAFELHKRGGSRLLLADQVGLGKTVQLALAAKLMALYSGGRVLALVPKPLLSQWQDELWNLLRLPCAVWTGTVWVDERGVTHPLPLTKCPRRFGIVSTGLLVRSPQIVDTLAELTYECIVLDEAHRARRKNLGQSHRNEPSQPNNLLASLHRLAPRTRSLLLATATPVQIDPIEARDLLGLLGVSHPEVLGSTYSRWITQPRGGLNLVLGRDEPPNDVAESWEWMRDPLPPASEDRGYSILRKELEVPEAQAWVAAEALGRLGPPGQSRIERMSRQFFSDHNPYIRSIVRRTRQYLESNIDPKTNEPYLKPVVVRLYGEGEADAVSLTGFLQDAYETAEGFCNEVGKRGAGSGFLKTILLRRVGSTIVAGRATAAKMLARSNPDSDEEDDDSTSTLYPLTPAEEAKLREFLTKLNAAHTADPKYEVVEALLHTGIDGTGPWLERGCIIFSQFYDSARWVAEQLSARFPAETVALYGSATRSGVFRRGEWTRLSRESVKANVMNGSIRILLGTDAASEGLNLQKIGTLINLDLPWNPTRLEQRKGRIQRIGQVRDEVFLYNMRYRGSVEDRVHQLLSARLADITALFGQVPDTLEDVWIAIAQGDEARALQIIGEVPEKSPFEIRYDKIDDVDWESCSTVLDSQAQLDVLLEGW